MNILVLSPIDSDALDILRQSHDVICAFDADEAVIKRLTADRDVLIFRSGVKITAEILKCAPALKLLLRAGSGIDNLDAEYIQEHGIRLARIPEPGAQAVAEMSFAMMLSLARNLIVADRLTRRGRWAKHEITGHLLTGKVLGIVGAGNIGTRVGQMGAAWGMRPVGCVENNYPPSVTRNLIGQSGRTVIRLTNFEEVISTADFLSIHVPLTDSTRNLIDAGVLSRMKKGAFLINLSRGGVVDEKALYQELTAEGGRLRGAALDVHAVEGEGKVSPLAGLDNIILTPHIGAMTIDTQRQIGRRIIEIIDDFAATDPISIRHEETPSLQLSSR